MILFGSVSNSKKQLLLLIFAASALAETPMPFVMSMLNLFNAEDVILKMQNQFLEST